MGEGAPPGVEEAAPPWMLEGAVPGVVKRVVRDGFGEGGARRQRGAGEAVARGAKGKTDETGGR